MFLSSSGIGRIDPTTHAIAAFPLPTVTSPLGGITAGSDGGVWFAAGNKIGRMDPITHAIAAFPLPSAARSLELITTGSDGGVWFTERFGHKIGRIDPTTHAIAAFPLPSAARSLGGITSGPDGGIWFTEEIDHKIGQAVLLTATRTQLFAAPNPSDLGQAVTFTAAVTPASGAEPPPGAVTFAIDGVARAPVPLTVVNGQARATFITTTLAPGRHVIVASYGGGGAFIASASDTVTQAIRPPAPQVIGLARYGIRWDATRIVLSFNQPMFAPSVQYVNNYAVLTNPYYHNQVVRIVSATYDPATHTVTLIPAIRLNIHYHYTLIVNGHGPFGANSAAGVFLDGAGNGTGGTDYVKTFGSESLVWPTPMVRPWVAPRPLVSRAPKLPVLFRYH
jgi:hypothetical protein